MLTSKGTFQKRFAHAELRAYLEQLTPVDAVAAAPNVYYLFRSEELRQRFLASRYRRTIAAPKLRMADVLYEQHQAILDALRESVTSLGRMPGPDELPEYPSILEQFGSLKQAFLVIRRVTGGEPWKEIASRRREDLLVYLALAKLGRRRPMSALPTTTQRDIKAFVGTYARAQTEANELLFSVGDPANIDGACQRANVGVLVDNALVLRRDTLDLLEPVLRVYEGCARAILGEVDDANVVKLHRYSGKVTYLVSDNLDTADVPSIRLRIKVTLPRLAVDVFDYTNDAEQPQLGLRLPDRRL